jgi:hypothetical protein
MKGTLQFQDFRLSTSSPSILERAAANPVKNFAGSKIPQRKGGKISATVTFKHWNGRVTTIECKSKSEIVKARKFFDMFRDEELGMRDFIREFPTKMGVIPKKFHSEIRKGLKELFNVRNKAQADWIIANI